MNPQQIRNLQLLIHHMETQVTRTLDMSMTFDSCGSPACAMGEASRIPEFGMEVMRAAAGHIIGSGVRYYGEFRFYDQVAYALFGNAAKPLFEPHPDGPWDSNKVTPQEWIAEARKVLHRFLPEPTLVEKFIESIHQLERETLAPKVPETA